MNPLIKTQKKINHKIKKGDYGFTGYIDLAIAYKSSWQAEACGTVDELNTFIGEAHSRIKNETIRADLLKISKDLFILGANIATSLTKNSNVPQINTRHIHKLEEKIVQYELLLSPLRHFIIPIGPPSVTILHQARAICRRAERDMVQFLKDKNKQNKINPLTLAYLNRLSDLLFSMSRFILKEDNYPEMIWSRENAD